MKKTELSTDLPSFYEEETDDKIIVHKFEREKSPEVFFGISGSWVTVVIIIVGCILYFSQSKTHDAGLQGGSSPQNQQTEWIMSWEETGCFFPNSDEYLINEEDIVLLASYYGFLELDIIQYAINEIYARNHYLFTDSEWLSFYSQYDWYSGYYSSEEARDQFNAVELQNLIILSELRRNY